MTLDQRAVALLTAAVHQRRQDIADLIHETDPRELQELLISVVVFAAVPIRAATLAADMSPDALLEPLGLYAAEHA